MSIIADQPVKDKGVIVENMLFKKTSQSMYIKTNKHYRKLLKHMVLNVFQNWEVAYTCIVRIKHNF